MRENAVVSNCSGNLSALTFANVRRFRRANEAKMDPRFREDDPVVEARCDPLGSLMRSEAATTSRSVPPIHREQRPLLGGESLAASASVAFNLPTLSPTLCAM